MGTTRKSTESINLGIQRLNHQPGRLHGANLDSLGVCVLQLRLLVGFLTVRTGDISDSVVCFCNLFLLPDCLI